MPDNYRGIPTRMCPCGSEWFNVPMTFDEDYEPAMWGTKATCFSCGAEVTAPCPPDLEEYDGILRQDRS